MVATVFERVHNDERALAFGDIGAEVFVLRLFFTNQVEQVVLNLKGETRVKAKRAKRLDLLLASAADNCATCQRNRAAVIRRLVRRHGKIVIDRQIEALVAHPTEIERLSLNRSNRHVRELA